MAEVRVFGAMVVPGRLVERAAAAKAGGAWPGAHRRHDAGARAAGGRFSGGGHVGAYGGHGGYYREG